MCWFQGIGAALALTKEIVINRRMALQNKYPYESESNAASWLPLLQYRPLISIVMPVFNSRWLDEAVASVLKQSYDNYEVLQRPHLNQPRKTGIRMISSQVQT